MKQSVKLFVLYTAVLGGVLLTASPATAHFGGMKGMHGMKNNTPQELQQKRIAYEKRLQDQGLSADEVSKRMKAYDTWQKIHTEVHEQKLKSIASATGKTVDQLKKELETKPIHQVLKESGLYFK